MGSIGDRTKNKEKPKLTEKDIQEKLRFFFSQPRYKLDNLYVFGWESDCLLLTKSGYWYEFEIKISRSDFKNDFKNKEEKHRILESKGETTKPNYFYYIVPEGLIEVEEVPPYAGLIYVTPNGFRNIVKAAPALHKVKNDPKDLNLTDKFYYNMQSAIHERNKAKREMAEFSEPYKDGLKKGKYDAIYAAKIALSKICPHAEKGKYSGILIRCTLKNRTCNRNCDFIGDFEENVENLLKSFAIK